MSIVDYHVHYYLDKCASSDMTLPNIDDCSNKLGIKEVAVLKHYSHCMPNGEDDWATGIKSSLNSLNGIWMKSARIKAGSASFSGRELKPNC